MRIRIYQVNMDRDTNNICFMSWDWAERHDFSSDIYDLIYDGELPVSTLEGVFALLNVGEKPEGYKGRSLSVSDVVELIEGDKSEFHYCDSFGWKMISFDKNKARTK